MTAVRIFLFLLVITILSTITQAQTSQEEFGQNRVQYKDFIWSYYQSERFAVYFYLGGQELGKFTILAAERELDSVEDKLEYKLSDKVDILVYNTLGDLKQSNIGYGVESNNTGGTTKIIGNKMFIYFDGNHHHLLKQIREGIAKICLESMMYGGSIQEVLQNAVLLNLPDWYTEGLASYISESWSTELDNRLRDGILSGKYKKFNRLSGADAKFAGQSVWYYIAQNYGAAAIPNVLYLTRINRSTESGFSFVLGKSLRQTLKDWYQYYFDLYTKEQTGKINPQDNDMVPLRLKKGVVYSQFRLNTTADKIAYVSNDIGKYKVKMKTLDENKYKTLLRGGFKNVTQPIDYSYPLTAWDPTGTKLAMVFEKRDKIYIRIYDTEGKKSETKLITNFQKILSISFGSDSRTLILSAVNRGQSDIYVMNIASYKVEQITNDFWDDLNPHWVKLSNRSVILWSSNRIDDTLRKQQLDTILPTGKFDLFFYNTKTKNKIVTRVSNTSYATESNPIAYNNNFFAYTSDRNGIKNRYIAYIDSVFDHYDHYYYFADSTVLNPDYNIDSLIAAKALSPDSTKEIPVFRDVAHTYTNTNYSSGIMEQETALKAGYVGELVLKDGKYFFYKTKVQKDIDLATVPLLNNTLFGNLQKKITSPVVSSPQTVLTDSLQSDSSKMVKSVFQSEFSNPANEIIPMETEEDFTSLSKQNRIKFSKILPYIAKFSTTYVVSQFDNSLIVNRYQSFASNGGQFVNPNLNAFIRVGTADLFEDYRVTGGFRMPTNLNWNTEYFISFEDLKHRLDKRYTFYRKTDNRSYDASPVWIYPVNAKAKTSYAEAALRYPLDYTKSLRGIFSYRNEKVVFLATDVFSLDLKDYNENWIAFRGEYVFDNTIKIQTNILNGWRYKIYGDIQRLIADKGPMLFAAGVDARYYQKIHRNIVWATRFNAATSWGTGKIVYYLGGVENQLLPTPSFNTQTTVSQDAGYAFQTLATNVRGFTQNARNGNSEALVNTEIRFPVFSYFISTPIRSEFIRNFQITLFGDVGSAWQGLSPYGQDNPFNTTVITQGPVTVKVNYFRQPVIIGYGTGIRTTFLGYFIRLDYARGFDSGIFNKPLLVLSLGTDF